jgi:poly(ADP-ribose) polymerase-like protein
VPHVIETASSGRAKCRGCDQKIAKDELRFGERQPNAFGEGEMTLWFHPRCAAYKRPEPFLEAVAAHPEAGFEDLAAAARFGIAHRRVPRINGAERAPTGRARCRKCRELIEKDEWRIALVFFEEFRFDPGGFVHARCARDYFETTDLLDRLGHFSPDLDPPNLAELSAALDRSTD